MFSYAHQFDNIVYNNLGYAIDVKTRKVFKSLSQLEKECKKIQEIKLVKKQKYYTKDVSDRNRKAKCLLYQSIE